MIDVDVRLVVLCAALHLYLLKVVSSFRHTGTEIFDTDYGIHSAVTE